MDYIESEGLTWKPKKVDGTLEGLLVSKETNVGVNSSTKYYIERLEDHQVVQLWGTTILDNRMMPVKIGQQVLITYKGLGEKGKGGKQAPHIWSVKYKDVDPTEIKPEEVEA